MVLGNTFHLFLAPGPRARRASSAACTSSCAGTRPIITDSGGFQVFSMGHGDGRRRDQGPRADAAATAPGPILSISEEGVRFRSYVDGCERFLGPETSMEVQAALGSDIALVFDECTPFHVTATTPRARRSAPTAGSSAACDWHAAHGPAGQLVYGIVQGGVDEDLRRESAQRCRRQRRDGIAIGGSLGAGQGADLRGRRLDDGRAERAPDRAAPPAGDRRRRRPDRRRRARHRHVRLRDADPAGPPRRGVGPRPGSALARRPRQGPLARDADEPILEGCPCPACARRLHARLPALPAAAARADRAAAVTLHNLRSSRG